MEAYLDNSATTPCYEEVRDIVVKTMMVDYGNPSAMHNKGVEAEQYIKQATKVIAATMKVQEKEIFFTSGGTESNNWALIGAAMANKRAGMHLITTAIEHPAISEPMSYLEDQGFRVTRLPVDRQGVISLEDLKAAITEDTILVSTMYVNNEIGSVQPITEIGKLVHEVNPKIIYHVDAIQAYGKYRILPKKMNIDMMSVSSHKIHGPKGVGFLYINSKIKCNPLILGGGQQLGMRSGTDNVPGIAGFGEAARIGYENLDEKVAKIRNLREYFVNELEKMEDVTVHGMKDNQGAPHIVNAAFLGVRSEVLLHTLEEKEIYISAGSACSTHKRSKSPTLTAIGASAEELESSVRFSLSEWTTKEQLDYCLDTIRQVLPMLRRYARH